MTRLPGSGSLVAVALILGACGQGTAASSGAPAGAAAPMAVSPPPAGATGAPSAAAPATQAAATQSAFTADLTGVWAGDVESCNGGEAVSFFADGTYGMEGEGGRWQLDGDQLELTGIRQFEMGGNGEVAVPDRTLTITQLTDQTMAWRADDGFEASFARCPG